MKTAMGIPTLAGTEHFGFTVPNLDEATSFFVNVIGGEVIFEAGPFRSDGDDMQINLHVHPRAISRLRMIRVKNGPSVEIFEYQSPDQETRTPRNSDIGGHHLAFYVDDIGSAVSYLRSHGIEIMGAPITLEEGPSAGLTYVYFLAPWGLQLELVSYPAGMGVEGGTSRRMWHPAAI